MYTFLGKVSATLRPKNSPLDCFLNGLSSFCPLIGGLRGYGRLPYPVTLSVSQKRDPKIGSSVGSGAGNIPSSLENSYLACGVHVNGKSFICAAA